MPHMLYFTLPQEDALDLAQTLDCGQAFRFSPLSDGRWEGVAGGRLCRIKKTGCTLEIECCCPGGCESGWFHYFDLARDYAALKESLRGDPILNKAVDFCPGMRLLRQEPWEALCSFIISQNNNISRIKGIIARLCESYGPPIPGGGHAFPSPQTVAELDEGQLAVLRAGFRAKYIHDAAQRVSSGALDLQALYDMPLEEARESLRTIQGVGPKVAECALLFGFARTECFPQDVWIKRAMRILYPDGFPRQFAPVAGIAQQYLFHYCRTCPEALEEAAAPAL